MGDVTTLRVLPRGSSWGVKKDGTRHPQSLHADRFDAIRRAKAAAHLLRPSRVVIHASGGDVEAVVSYRYCIGPANPAALHPEGAIQWIGERDDREPARVGRDREWRRAVGHGSARSA